MALSNRGSSANGDRAAIASRPGAQIQDTDLRATGSSPHSSASRRTTWQPHCHPISRCHLRRPLPSRPGEMPVLLGGGTGPVGLNRPEILRSVVMARVASAETLKNRTSSPPRRLNVCARGRRLWAPSHVMTCPYLSTGRPSSRYTAPTAPMAERTRRRSGPLKSATA